MGDVKYAVVRVQGEQRMIDLFTLLVSHGYSDVSFVSSLAHTILKTETSPAQEEASTSRVSSSSAAVRGSATAAAAAGAAAVSTTTAEVQQQPQPQPSTTPQLQQQQGRVVKTADEDSSPPKAANAADLLQSLFDKSAEEDNNDAQRQLPAQHQQWVLPSGEIPPQGASFVAQPMMMPMQLIPGGGFACGDFGGGPMQPMSLRSMNYSGIDGTGRKVPFNVRMKGWQRKMLNEAMATGIPSGAELKDLCERCQVTETQAIRFFRKRRQPGDSTYQAEDDGDGRGDSPEMLAPPVFQLPKVEEMD